MIERGSGRSAPRDQTRDAVVAGCTTGSPSSRARSTRLGTSGQHRLGPDVDPDAGDLGAAELAAEARARLEEDDVVVGAEQVGRREPGDPAPDDHDLAHAANGNDPVTGGTRRLPRTRPSIMTTTAHRRSFTVAALGVAALLTLVACSGADGDDAGGSTADSAAQPQGASAERQLGGSGDDAGGAEAPAEDGADADVSSGGSDGSVAVPVLDAERSVISTAVVSVRSDDATRTRTEVMRIVDVHRGQVSDEETSTDESGQVQLSRLVLRIPASDFAETVGELEKVGELASSDKSSEDVSFDVIDTRARIRAQEQSLRRVELLLERAESIRDVVSIESELTRRQAELEALKSKQAYLSDQTTYATVTVYVEQKGEREKPAEARHRRVRLPGRPRQRLDGAGGLRDRAGHHRGRAAAVAGGARDPGLADLAAGPPIRPPSPGRPRCADGGCARMNVWMSSLPPSPC